MKTPTYLSSSLLTPLCFFIPSAQADSCSTLVQMTTISQPTITINPDTPIGAPIGQELIGPSVEPFQCRTSILPPKYRSQEFGVRGRSEAGEWVTIINGRAIYPTTMPGIGYAIGAQSYTPQCLDAVGFVTGVDNVGPNNRLICSINGVFSKIQAAVRVQFYKTAQVTKAGIVWSQTIGDFILRHNNSTWNYPESEIKLESFNISMSSCIITNANITVPMGQIKTGMFNGPGTSPDETNTRNFDIPLRCNSGTTVRFKVDGNAYNAEDGVINLSDETQSAKGVGIQILRGDRPLPLSTVINTGTALATGTYNIPLKARYYQTASTITSGTANASATFTLTYE